MRELSRDEFWACEEALKRWNEQRLPKTFGRVTLDERHAFFAGFLAGRRTARLPGSISEALNSGDGSYRP